MTRYRLDVALTIAGPFLIGATSPDTYGLDRAFHRDYRNCLVVPASHFKGKLRAALAELGSALDCSWEDWFGLASAEGCYKPRKGLLEFADLVCDHESHKQGARSRAAMNRATGTAADQMLRTVEAPYDSDEEITCQGAIQFEATDSHAAQEIARILWVGLQWLPNLGGQKGVGYGRLQSVSLQGPTAVPSAAMAAALGSATRFRLSIQACEPLLIGGVKRPSSNYVASENELPGGLIKGALAAGLNRAFGFSSHCALSGESASSYLGYEQLVMHYDRIRVTHALPAREGNPRPVRMPLSTIEVNKQKIDSALVKDRVPLVGGLAPTYFIDWKTPQTYIGGAPPARFAMTRTAVHAASGRAADEQLFTYQRVGPNDDQDEPLRWLCDVDVSQVPASDQQQVKAQFAKAAVACLHGLGRGSGRVMAQVTDDCDMAQEGSAGVIRDGLAIVVLQSDAVMLDPEDVRRLDVADDLGPLYAAFWQERSGGQGACLELEDFWAHQCFKGGYLYRRYLAASHPEAYRPYYLTAAGSVFRLRVLDEERARPILERWRREGLPLPEWAKTAYGVAGTALWQTCPFVPQNGYGEVAINLDWHWLNHIPDDALSAGAKEEACNAG